MVVTVLNGDVGRVFVDNNGTGAFAFVVLVALPVLLVVSLAISEKCNSIHHQQVATTALRQSERKFRRLLRCEGFRGC